MYSRVSSLMRYLPSPTAKGDSCFDSLYDIPTDLSIKPPENMSVSKKNPSYQRLFQGILDSRSFFHFRLPAFLHFHFFQHDGESCGIMSKRLCFPGASSGFILSQRAAPFHPFPTVRTSVSLEAPVSSLCSRTKLKKLEPGIARFQPFQK